MINIVIIFIGVFLWYYGKKPNKKIFFGYHAVNKKHKKYIEYYEDFFGEKIEWFVDLRTVNCVDEVSIRFYDGRLISYCGEKLRDDINKKIIRDEKLKEICGKI